MSSDITIEQEGACVIATIGVSYVTHLEMQELVNEFSEKMRYDNARVFVLDMSKVEFLSSACLGVLVGYLQEIEHVKGRIALAGCTDDVAFLFKVTRLDSVFTMCDDVDDARVSLKAA